MDRRCHFQGSQNCPSFQKIISEEFYSPEIRNEEKGRELSLLLDRKTRWNSLIAMIERFILLKKPVSKALIDISSAERIDLIDLEILENICICLKPIEMAVSALSRRDATLLSAEGIYRFFMDQFEKISSISFSHELKSAVEFRFSERRQYDIINLHRFLHNPTTQTHRSTIPSKHKLVSTAKHLLVRLFPSSVVDCEILNIGESSNEIQVEQETSCEIGDFTNSNCMQVTEIMLGELENAICQSTTTKFNIPIQTNLDHIIKNEMDLFRKTGTESKHLTLLLEALDSIPPTSVESERAFSAAGLFITKIRSRLGDDTLDSLCFLKSYFRQLKN